MTTTTYKVGDVGPHGGKVVSVKGDLIATVTKWDHSPWRWELLRVGPRGGVSHMASGEKRQASRIYAMLATVADVMEGGEPRG